jgi:hypothetical protein
MICVSEQVTKMGSSSRPSMLTCSTGTSPLMGCN